MLFGYMKSNVQVVLAILLVSVILLIIYVWDEDEANRIEWCLDRKQFFTEWIMASPIQTNESLP
jgi:uncharacterized membrane protein YsdA (DUF1294 family)